MSLSSLSQVDDSIKQLLETYNELNSAHIHELDEAPSALEFMRFVAQNRPFVVRNACSTWNAVKQWSASYLTHVLGDDYVNVAITPLGYVVLLAEHFSSLVRTWISLQISFLLNLRAFLVQVLTARSNADSVVSMSDGSLSFVKPLERKEKFRHVLADIQAQELSDTPSQRPTKYAQTQNDNLRDEYSKLFHDVPKDIPFARIALEQNPDAVNFWLGNSHSVTAMHKDNYENIYAQIRGKKHFVLLPPVASPSVNEQELPEATYVRNPSAAATEDIEASELDVHLDEPHGLVPVAVWDPDKNDVQKTPYSNLIQPMRVTLNQGDMLYLPAMWYHKVSQSCGDEAFCCAVNYWYDLQFGGAFWATNAFIRDVGNIMLDDSRLKVKSGVSS